jgi:energy-coupling factor transporter transmembrane protein EcfT
MKKTKKILVEYYKRSKKFFLILSLFFFIVSSIFFFPSFINWITYPRDNENYIKILEYVKSPNIWARYNFLSHYEEAELMKLYFKLTGKKLTRKEDYSEIIDSLLIKLENNVKQQKGIREIEKEFLNFLLRRKKLGIKAGLQTAFYYFLAAIAFLIVAIFTGKKKE